MAPNPSRPRKPAPNKFTTTTTPSSKSTPAKQPKKKFVPKTHTTAGVAISKKNNNKRPKDPKKQREALLARLEKELPKLNMITPAGVVKPKGRKKGKVFVEDREKMMGILNRVSDGVEGRERSKLERAVSYSLSRCISGRDTDSAGEIHRGSWRLSARRRGRRRRSERRRGAAGW